MIHSCLNRSGVISNSVAAADIMCLTNVCVIIIIIVVVVILYLR